MKKYKICKNNFGVFYISDEYGNVQFLETKILASSNFKKIQEIFKKIKNNEVRCNN